MNAPTDFARAMEQHGIAFDDGDLARLGRYLDLLLEANTRFNLTAITEPAEAWSRHVGDSLTLLPLLVSLDAQTVIDVGSGGGMPGIPLAIAMPDVCFTLLEATGKKARFLETVAADLALPNVEVVADRAETIGRDRERHREHYDVAIARAVGRLAVLLELTVPLVRVGGHLLAIKGERAGEEIDEAKQALHLLHSHFIDTHRTETGTIVVIEKMRRTPKLYPRRPGEPKRVPLR
jgi:16S rRNA (guanine527-N7)-methyltransferase